MWRLGDKIQPLGRRQELGRVSQPKGTREQGRWSNDTDPVSTEKLI